MNHVRSKIGVAAAIVAAAVMPGGVADAGPGACRVDDTGCTSFDLDDDDQYRFNSSDTNLSDNYYVSEACRYFPGCPPELKVEDNLGRMRLNHTGYVRMCIYANRSYSTPIYWVTTHHVWATTGEAGKSLRYRTSNSC